MNTIKLGLGEVVILTGTSNGKPCVIIEPVSVTGIVGKIGPDELNHGPVTDGGTVIEIHDKAAAEVLIETIRKALTHV